MEAFPIILVAIVVVLVIRLVAAGMDQDRIKDYIEQHSGRILDSSWSPFGPGWLGSKTDRFYRVRYVDHDGNTHEAHCKTSLWTGVYFTEDRITQYARRPSLPDADTENDLELENQQLREELERLRREQRRE